MRVKHHPSPRLFLPCAHFRLFFLCIEYRYLDIEEKLTGVSSARLVSFSPVTSSQPGTFGAEEANWVLYTLPEGVWTQRAFLGFTFRLDQMSVGKR